MGLLSRPSVEADSRFKTGAYITDDKQLWRVIRYRVPVGATAAYVVAENAKGTWKEVAGCGGWVHGQRSFTVAEVRRMRLITPEGKENLDANT